GPDLWINSCTLVGVVADRAERVRISRSTLRGMGWDCAIDITGGSGHRIDTCEISDVLEAVRITGALGPSVRGNRIRARWWAIQLVDTEGAEVVGNSIERTMRA